MYKVFINDTPLFFSKSKDVLALDGQLRYVPFTYSSSFQKKVLIDMKTELLCLVDKDVVKAFEYFFKDYKFILAAGGIVENNKNEVLFIFRNNTWDLPKGKVEKGEGLAAAAIREVEEECGLNGPTITNELVSTYHTYETNGKKFLKRTCWYTMKYEKNHVLIPQIEEGITKVEWINKNQLEVCTDDTYESIKAVVLDFLIKN